VVLLHLLLRAAEPRGSGGEQQQAQAEWPTWLSGLWSDSPSQPEQSALKTAERVAKHLTAENIQLKLHLEVLTGSAAAAAADKAALQEQLAALQAANQLLNEQLASCKAAAEAASSHQQEKVAVLHQQLKEATAAAHRHQQVQEKAARQQAAVEQQLAAANMRCQLGTTTRDPPTPITCSLQSGEGCVGFATMF